jgi:hypothetical protein
MASKDDNKCKYVADEAEEEAPRKKQKTIGDNNDIRHLAEWSRQHLLQRGPCDPSNPDSASKHAYDSFSTNGGIRHVAVMIIFLVIEALST